MNENRRLSDEMRLVKREYDNFKRTNETQKQNLENQKKKLIEEYENKMKMMSESIERERKR